LRGVPALSLLGDWLGRVGGLVEREESRDKTPPRDCFIFHLRNCGRVRPFAPRKHPTQTLLQYQDSRRAAISNLQRAKKSLYAL
jgi:hypothetical protein